jgi:RHS repeat-associated protein
MRYFCLHLKYTINKQMGAFKLDYGDFFYCTKKCSKSNHLGNVLTVFTDKKIPVGTGTTVSYYKADILSSMDYSPFGAPLKGRTFNGSGSRYGFNGKEKTDEVSGGGNNYDYGFRIYNPRLGKFLSVDPLFQSFAWYTPYQFAGNKPIVAIDLDGLEEFIIHEKNFKNSRGDEFLYKANYTHLKPLERGNPNDGTYMIVNSDNELKTEYFKSYLERNTKDDANRLSYRAAKKNYTDTKLKYGVSYVKFDASIPLAPDKGVNAQVKSQFNSVDAATKNNIDEIAGALTQDPNSTLTITGIASQKATNLSGTSNETNSGNNTALANYRASAGKDFIIQYIKENYNYDINPNRIVTNSEVRDSSGENNGEGNLQQDRAVEFHLNTPQ